MTDAYPGLAADSLRYRFCPRCASRLDDSVRDAVNGRPRPTCPDCGWVYYPPNHQGALVVVEHLDGLVLLRPPGLAPAAPWALPGGIAEFAEAPEDCARREVREETGLEIEVVDRLCIFFDAARADGRPLPFGPMLTFGFVGRVVGGRIREGDEGPVEIRPRDPAPVISPDRPGSARVLDAYLGR